MLQQRTVLTASKRRCCLFLIALGITLLGRTVRADESPSAATGSHPNKTATSNSDLQAVTLEGLSGDQETKTQTSAQPSAPAAATPDKSAPAQPRGSSGEPVLVSPSGQPFAWAADGSSYPYCPVAEPGEFGNPSDVAFRFGYWGVNRSGNPWVIGQWQSTNSSPFWDIDGLWTNGTRTFNYSATGPDNEDTQAKLQFYGPNSQGFVNINRFIHAEEHESFDNMNASSRIPGTGPGSGQPVIPQDMTPGQDYAIRVEQYEAQYKYNLIGQPNKEDFWITARINVWDQREFGSLQANNYSHCFMANAALKQQPSCHIQSIGQGIDWNTFEVTPTFEAKLGIVNVQYSHTLRVFNTSDQTVLGNYNAPTGQATWLQGMWPYSVTPESLFNMDKVKLGIDLNDHNHIFAYGYYGEVENSDAGVSRQQGGVDLRWTNSAIKGLKLVTYFKNDNQSGNRPTALLSPDQVVGLTAKQQAAELFQLPQQIGFNRYTVGEKFSWRPWVGNSDAFVSRLAFTGGYEFDYLTRSNENWYFPNLNATPPNFNISPTTAVFYQPNTVTNAFNVGVQVPWSEGIHTSADYKMKFVKNQLYGYTPLNLGENTSLPGTENIIDLEADWLPSTHFGVSAHQSFDLSYAQHNPLPLAADRTVVMAAPGDTLNFGEASYSTALMLWYRPTEKATVSLNADYFVNQIKQNITIGDDSDTSFSGSGANFISFAPNTSPWSYGGTAVEFGGGLHYQLTHSLRLTADYEVTFGKDLVTSGGVVNGVGTPPVNTYVPLGSFSAVRNTMHQLSTGVDYRPRSNLAMYARYQFVGFEDIVTSSNTGNLNMFLAGLTYKW